MLQAVAGSSQSAKRLLVGPFCAVSLLVEQISGRSARMFSAQSLLVRVIQMLKRCSARAVLLLQAGQIPRRLGVISFPRIGSRYRHSAADLMLKTCAASASKFQVSTDPAQKMCAATGVRQRPATFYQQISCMSKRIKACRGQKRTEDHAGPFWHKILAPSRCFPYKKSAGPPLFLHKCTTKSCSADLYCSKSCCSWLTRPLSQICKQAATCLCREFADL